MKDHTHARPDAFGREMAASYDNHQRLMAPIYDNLHYLIRVVLSGMPEDARILSVGAGTGTEILRLAEAFPRFSFVAVDPSAEMLAVCRSRLQEMGVADRCRFVHGFVGDIPSSNKFDAALCLLVAHHVSRDERRQLVAGVAERLEPKGCFIISEISFDDASDQSGNLLEKWKSLVRLTGAPEEKVQILPKLFREHLSVLSPADAEDVLVTNGFEAPIQFFQALLIRAWYARKKGEMPE